MKLFHVIKAYSRRGIFAAVVISGVVSGLLSTGLLFLINEYLYGEAFLSGGKLVLAFFVMLPLVMVARYIASYTLTLLGQRATYELRVDLTDRILTAPLRRLEEQGPAKLMVALTEDIESVTDALANMPQFFINAAVVVGCLAYMGWLSWPVLLAVLVFILVGVISYQIPLMAGIRVQELAREVEDELFDCFRGSTQGTKELKMRRSRRLAFMDMVRKIAGRQRSLEIKASKIFIAAGTWGNAIFFLLLGTVLFFLPLWIDGLDRKVLGSYTLVLFYMLTPLQMVLNDLPGLTNADVSVRKIEGLGISLTSGVSEAEGTSTAKPEWNRLAARNIAHTYRHDSADEEFSLGPMNLEFQPGELVFIVGGNGSGKTTLAKVLMGLYPPEEGELFLDGEAIDDSNRSDYREQFAAVFSDFFLFETLLGLESPDLDENAREYLKDLHLKHKVRIENGRLSTLDLSQGQRKRLALLTAYLEDSPIFLFDEWAADQDPEFKKVFYHHLLPELKRRGKLVLAISHDDAYYHMGDRIIKLDYGQLVYDKPVDETEYYREAV
ncbi:MAG: cyclic peptide export ABC transporter [Acidobacteriota bacterium]|nr:cyclic peptide export ABC transporter [Acidobacteriota bacterium]